MFERWFALDPGSYEMRLYDFTGRKSAALRSLTAYEDNIPAACGSAAREYIYKEKPKYQVRYPLLDGFEEAGAACTFQQAFSQVDGERYLLRPSFLVCLDGDEKESVKEGWRTFLASRGAAKVVFHSALDFLQTEEDSLLVHAGFSKTRIMLTIQGAPEISARLEKGGRWLAGEILKLAAARYQAMISMEDALALLEEASNALKAQRNPLLSCTGVDKYQQYVNVSLKASQIGKILQAYEEEVCDLCSTLLLQLSHDSARQLLENGIFLSGGLGNLAGFKNCLERKFNARVHLKKEPGLELFENMKGWR